MPSQFHAQCWMSLQLCWGTQLGGGCVKGEQQNKATPLAMVRTAIWPWAFAAFYSILHIADIADIAFCFQFYPKFQRVSKASRLGLETRWESKCGRSWKPLSLRMCGALIFTADFAWTLSPRIVDSRARNEACHSNIVNLCKSLRIPNPHQWSFASKEAMNAFNMYIHVQTYFIDFYSIIYW